MKKVMKYFCMLMVCTTLAWSGSSLVWAGLAVQAASLAVVHQIGRSFGEQKSADSPCARSASAA